MTTIGLWLSMPEPLVVEAAARAGPDWVGLDLQHGAWDLGTAFRGIQLLDALGTAALVRVSEQELEAALAAIAAETERAERLASRLGGGLRAARALARKGYPEDVVERTLRLPIAEEP